MSPEPTRAEYREAWRTLYYLGAVACVVGFLLVAVVLTVALGRP